MGDRDLLRLLGDDLLHRLARQARDLALEVPDAGLARVVADQVADRGVGDRPFPVLEPVRLADLAHQVALRDLDLLILRVAGDADDLHAVEQRLRHAEAVRGGHEHHVRQVVVHLEVVVREGRVLLGVQHLQQRGGRVPAPVRAELVDLVQQEERVRRLRLLHALDHLAGHGADIGPAMAAHLGLVAHAAQRHAHEVAPRRLRDGLAERGLAHAGRPDQAQDRPLDLRAAALDRQVLDDPLLDLLEAEVVGVEHLLRLDDVVADLGALLPGDGEHPVEVVAHHRRLGAHRRHAAELLEFLQRLLARFLRQLGGLDPRLELGGFVLAVLALAEFLLDRLELLVQVVLALRLLHLPLHAVADALLHLQHADLALHMGEDTLEPRGDGGRLQQLLLLGDLEAEVGGDGVGELRGLLDLVDRDEHLGRDLLVELDVLLELGDDRARQRLRLARFGGGFLDGFGEGLEVVRGLLEGHDLGAPAAFDQHLHRAVGQFQQLQHRGDGADLVEVVRARVVLRRVLLRDEEDLLVVLHHRLERADGFLAADEEGDDHVREHHDVPQGEHRKEFAADGIRHVTSLGTVGARPAQRRHGRGATASIRHGAAGRPLKILTGR